MDRATRRWHGSFTNHTYGGKGTDHTGMPCVVRGDEVRTIRADDGEHWPIVGIGGIVVVRVAEKGSCVSRSVLLTRHPSVRPLGGPKSGKAGDSSPLGEWDLYAFGFPLALEGKEISAENE